VRFSTRKEIDVTKPRSVVSFTPESLKVLKRAYDKAIAEGRDQFVFHGHPLLVSYAKYLIEFLEAAFKDRP
jgi:hypothetical protein